MLQSMAFQLPTMILYGSFPKIEVFLALVIIHVFFGFSMENINHPTLGDAP